MPSPLVTVYNISKTLGAKSLFEDLSFSIFEGERIGLIGPNGAGKSTLLKIICGLDKPDQGDVSKKSMAVLSFSEQVPNFHKEKTITEQLLDHVKQNNFFDDCDAPIKVATVLSQCGFNDFDMKIALLSGGWLKRLSIAQALVSDPDLLILDEPTNHMDWEAIFWLESTLKLFQKSLIIVSHDRMFLARISNRILELNSLYEKGYLSFNKNYTDFLKEKNHYIDAQLKLQSALTNKAKKEVEWLRSGVKARTTKSRSRIDKTYRLLDELEKVKNRNKAAQIQSRIEVDTQERKTKKLLEIKNFSLSFTEDLMIHDLNIRLGPKTCLGLLGNNGSGKTSLLKSINRELNIYKGEIFYADQLKIVYFEQNRDSLPLSRNLMEFLGDGTDYVTFKNQSVHVSSYASRFLFTPNQLNQEISRLSGGEQARLLLAKILLQPADVLILDEPTNDLDIESIEVLEETINQFEGLVLLVSHDRWFLEQTCTEYLALDGQGHQTRYADLLQWLKDRNETKKDSQIKLEKNKPIQSTIKKPKLSYKDKKRLLTIETEIEQAEAELSEAQLKLELPEILSDSTQLNEQIQIITNKKNQVDSLYTIWNELEEKK